ncbi:MAG: NnrU family protein [Pseudomonadota bacterium]
MLLACLVFVGSHVLISRTALRPWLVRVLGLRSYLLAYSLLSVVLLGWVVYELLRAPRQVFWISPDWAAGFALFTSAVGFALLGLGAALPNARSISLRPVLAGQPTAPVLRVVRHPLIYGFGLWGLAHVPANGEWPTLALFGGTVVFALIGARAVSRRMDAAAVENAHGNGTNRSFGSLTVLGAAAGLFLWGLALIAHPWVTGVDPLTVWAGH